MRNAPPRCFRVVGLGLIALASVATPPAPRAEAGVAGSTRTAAAIVQKWPENCRDAARAMLEKYGPPVRVSADELAWDARGPWQEIVVYRGGRSGFWGLQEKNCLEQGVSYKIPDDKIGDLKRFDNKIAYNKLTGDLSSRSESESMNFLALNLAEEIVAGRQSVDDARDFYFRTKELSKSGKDSPYLRGLLFAAAGADGGVENPGSLEQLVNP